MSKLFEPLTIREITFKNRIAVSPMCQYSSEDGFANDWHLVHLGSRAVGGAGLIISEATAVCPEGRISPGDLGIWKDEHIEFLKRITNFITKNGSVPGIQLAHAGRKGSHAAPWEGNHVLPVNEKGWVTMAPSAIAYKDTDPVPTEMSVDDIHQLIVNFEKAAARALEAGFKVIELHAAHGYLLNQFLSPISNKRADEYGGSFENRCRLLLVLCENVRKVIGEAIPLFVRISATDWVEGGWTDIDSVQLALLLKAHSVDLVDCSSGGNAAAQQIPVGALYQLPFAEKVKKEADILTGAVGMITTAEEAEMIISEGKADMVLLAREFLREPYFALHSAATLGEEIEWPQQYTRGKK